MLRLLALVGLLLLSSSAHADVRSRPCPFSCRTEGIPKDHCRDWREGDTCYVDDTRQNQRREPPRVPESPRRPEPPREPAVYSQGYLDVRLCPHNCRSAGIEKRVCRDWREGDVCYVEDMRRPRQSGPISIPRPPSPPAPPIVGDPPGRLPEDPWRGSQGECQGVSRQELSRPRVNIYKVRRAGSMFGSKLKVSGSVEGVCLAEAGSYENGRPEDPIRVSPQRNFKRFDFDVYVKGDKNPEIRVYNTAGDSAVVRVEGEDEYRDDNDRYRERYDDRYRGRYPDRRDERYDDYRDDGFRW